MAVVKSRGEAIAMGLIVALLLGSVHALLMTSPATAAPQSVCPPPGAVAGDVFADDDGNVHEPAINCAAQYDLVGGFGWGGYGPGRSLTRAQMASMLVGFLDVAGADLPAASGAPDVFDDDNGSVHEFNINVLAALGAAKGVHGRRFAPNQPVNRAQMTSFLVRALEQASGGSLDDAPDAFDDDTGSVHEDAINALAAAGAVRGVAPRRFGPQLEVTRAQTASFIIAAAELLADEGAWAPTHGAAVALEQREVAAGSPVSGTVMGGRMVGARVSGCGLQREALQDDDPGKAGLQFSAVVPATQPEGDCVLTFVVSFTDAPSEAVEETISVTPSAVPPSTPAGPSTPGGGEGGGGGGSGPLPGGPILTSCSRSGQRSPANPEHELVEFTFDREVSEVEPVTQPGYPEPGPDPNPGSGWPPVPNASRFHVYRFDGTNYNASLIEASDTSVTAEFPAEQLHNTTLCTVDAGVVRDARGAPNPVGDAALAPPAQPLRVTAAPDLNGVSNIRTDVVGRIYADFTFDEPVFNDPAPGRFQLILTDGAQARGAAVFMATHPPGQEPFTPPASVISVRFNEVQSSLPFSQIVRGVVQEDTVCDSTSRCNPLQTVDVSAEGTTAAPDLVSARMLNSAEVEFTFDDSVALQQPNEISTDSPRFGIYDGAGRWNVASLVQVHSDPRVVIAHFDGTAASAPSDRASGAATGQEPVNISTTSGIGAFIFEGSVRQTSNPDILVANADDEVPLQPVESTPGRTLRPDLTAVTVITHPVSQERVVRYTFDESVAAHLDGVDMMLPNGSSRPDDFTCEDFALYDADGVARSPAAAGAACTAGPAGSTTTIRGVQDDGSSVDVHGFSAAAVDAALLAAVNDAGFELHSTDAFGAVNPAGVNPQDSRMRFPEGAEVIARP